MNKIFPLAAFALIASASLAMAQKSWDCARLPFMPVRDTCGVRSVTEYAVSNADTMQRTLVSKVEYDKHGYRIAEQNFRRGTSLQYSNRYDKAGRLLRQVAFCERGGRPADTSSVVEVTYGADGMARRVVVRRHVAGAKAPVTVRYELDGADPHPSGRKMTCRYKRLGQAAGEVVLSRRFDERGRMVEDNVEEVPRGLLHKRVRYHYLANGWLQSRVLDAADGYDSIAYVRDKFGMLTGYEGRATLEGAEVRTEGRCTPKAAPFWERRTWYDPARDEVCPSEVSHYNDRGLLVRHEATGQPTTTVFEHRYW